MQDKKPIERVDPHDARKSNADRCWKMLRELSLPGKLMLAAVSAVSTWPTSQLAARWDRAFDLPVPAWMGWHSILHGLFFGALVMVPYLAASTHRILRAAAMCIASILIYDFAIGFVVDGPLSDNTVMPYVLAGGAAAMLLGFTVAVLGPCKFQWRLAGLTLLAGAIGGGAFHFLYSETFIASVLAYLAWQILVCLALYFGMRKASA